MWGGYVLFDAEGLVEFVWNVMAHAQKPDIVFWWNGRVHLNQRGCQFSRLLAAEVCASAVVMLNAPYSEVVWRVLATHSVRQFPLHFPCRASRCAITFQMESIFCVMLFVTQRGPAVAQACSYQLLIMHVRVRLEAGPHEFVVVRVTLGDIFQSESSISSLPQIFLSCAHSFVMSVSTKCFML
jgi:hypothetical protein